MIRLRTRNKGYDDLDVTLDLKIPKPSLGRVTKHEDTWIFSPSEEWEKLRAVCSTSLGELQDLIYEQVRQPEREPESLMGNPFAGRSVKVVACPTGRIRIGDGEFSYEHIALYGRVLNGKDVDNLLDTFNRHGHAIL